jgi:NarL family two-component system response regulator LiaR
MINVSIVEDNSHYRSALSKLFDGSDLFRLSGAYSSAEEAWPKLLMNQPDIAIVDIRLPAMSGISLIQNIRKDMPLTQFMVCTSYYENDRIIEALKAGASGYILKDTSAEDIKRAVKELFMGGAPMSPYIARKLIGLFQQSEPDSNAYGLSEREQEVLRLLSDGLQYKEIAESLFISSNTVKNHLKSIYKKLHVQNKIEAINKFQAK